MIHPAPVQLEGHGVRLEPMDASHASALRDAALDGQLWALWFTPVPEPDKVDAYSGSALEAQRAGLVVPGVVRELSAGSVVGSTRYHDIVASIDRVEICYTWYAKSGQRT